MEKLTVFQTPILVMKMVALPTLASQTPIVVSLYETYSQKIVEVGNASFIRGMETFFKTPLMLYHFSQVSKKRDDLERNQS